MFETMEMLDMMEDFILHAHECYLGDDADRVEAYYLYNLQEFIPATKRYDVIWMQWIACEWIACDRPFMLYILCSNVLPAFTPLILPVFCLATSYFSRCRLSFFIFCNESSCMLVRVFLPYTVSSLSLQPMCIFDTGHRDIYMKPLKTI